MRKVPLPRVRVDHCVDPWDGLPPWAPIVGIYFLTVGGVPLEPILALHDRLIDVMYTPLSLLVEISGFEPLRLGERMRVTDPRFDELSKQAVMLWLRKYVYEISGNAEADKIDREARGPVAGDSVE